MRGARGTPHVSKRTVDGPLLLHDEAGGVLVKVGVARVVRRWVDLQICLRPLPRRLQRRVALRAAPTSVLCSHSAIHRITR